MNISAKTEYACIAVLELAATYGSGRPVQIRKIADAHGIPSRFLVQILLQLKSAGLVTSTRGAAGGYQLAQDPATITLWDVMRVVDGQEAAVTSNTNIATPTSQALLGAWRKAAARQRESLQAVTFAQLAERVRQQAEGMYYI